MSQQLNFKRLSIEMKEKINDVLNTVTDIYPSEINKKGDALFKVCMLFKENYDKIGFKEIPLDIQGTINAVGCDYLKFNSLVKVFQCYESYHKNKKTYPIDSKHDKVLEACRLCIKGKSDAIRYRVEEGFRRKGINNIFNLTKLLVRMDIEGAVAQIFLCQAKQFTDDEIIISPDQVHLKCPNLDGELVLIDEYCTIQTDPSTMNPPCKWLIAPFLRVPIKPAPEAQAVIEEMKRLRDESTIEEPQQEPIEVEATIIDVEPSETAIHEALDKMICPKCGSKVEEDAEDSSELYCEKCNYGWRYKRKQSVPEIIEEGESIPIEDAESNLSEEEQTKLTELEESEPQNARDIFAKEDADKKKAEEEKKEEI